MRLHLGDRRRYRNKTSTVTKLELIERIGKVSPVAWQLIIEPSLYQFQRGLSALRELLEQTRRENAFRIITSFIAFDIARGEFSLIV